MGSSSLTPQVHRECKGIFLPSKMSGCELSRRKGRMEACVNIANAYIPTLEIVVYSTISPNLPNSSEGQARPQTFPQKPGGVMNRICLLTRLYLGSKIFT